MGKRYIAILLRWSWILVVAAILAAGTAYWFAKDESMLYTAQSNLLVGPGIDSPNTDLNTLRAGGQLMQTYAELPTTTPFLQTVINELNINTTPEELLEIIKIQSSDVTQILRVEVTHSNPDLAIAVANAIAENLVRNQPSNPESASTQFMDQIHSRVDYIEESIDNAEERILKIEADIAAIQLQVDRPTGDIGTLYSISMAEAQIKQFEVRLQTAADQETKRQEGIKILEELKLEPIQRIQNLDTDLKNTVNFNIQKLIIAQLADERSHLSNLERTLLETQRPIGGKTLEELIYISEAKVTELEETIEDTNYLESLRLFNTQLQDEREYLNELRSIEIDREGKVLEQIAEERNRLSEIQQFDVERKNVLLTERVERQSFLLTQLEDERRSLDELRSTLPLLYASLLEPITNQVKIIETVSNAVPVPSWLWLKVLVSGAAGFVISLLLIIGLEYLSDTIETQNDLEVLTGRPVLGVISRHKRVLNAGRTELVVKIAPESPAVEDYRTLSTKLLIAHKSNPIHSMVLTSTAEKEDATEVAVNLAIVLSQTGKKVTFIDANLHTSNLSRFFDCEGKPDLAEILSDPSGDLELSKSGDYPNLSIIPTGVSSSEAFKLLTSAGMKELITRLTDQDEMVIISAPAILTSADSLNLSSQVDGVVLVAYLSQTKQKDIQRTAESLKTVGVHLIGSILTKNHSRRSSGWSHRLRRFQANLSTSKFEEQTDSTKESPEALASVEFTEEDHLAKNLTAPFDGGGQIRVPDLDDARDSGSSSILSTTTDDGSIRTSFPLANINTANREELIMLPRIGSALAKAIVSYRESLGEFTRIEDVQKVTGMGPAVFGSIKDRITVIDKPAEDQ